jgi:protein ImuA
MSAVTAQQMESLKARIAALETRPILGEGAVLLKAGTGAGVLAAPPGLLHEVYTDERRNGGAALGFALGQARSLITPTRPAVLYLQLAAEAQELGLPYGAGLKSFGFDPDTLIIGRIANAIELLWAMEEAISCRAVAAVIADIAGHPRALDFTASRRLSLRAASAGASVILMRYGRDREASAAQLRWKLTPVLSRERMFDARAPGNPRWAIDLEKGQLGAIRAGSGRVLLDWTDNGFAVGDSAGAAERAFPATAPYGADPAALGDRLSQTA